MSWIPRSLGTLSGCFLTFKQPDESVTSTCFDTQFYSSQNKEGKEREVEAIFLIKELPESVLCYYWLPGPMMVMQTLWPFIGTHQSFCAQWHGNSFFPVTNPLCWILQFLSLAYNVPKIANSMFIFWMSSNLRWYFDIYEVPT